MPSSSNPLPYFGNINSRSLDAQAPRPGWHAASFALNMRCNRYLPHSFVTILVCVPLVPFSTPVLVSSWCRIFGSHRWTAHVRAGRRTIHVSSWSTPWNAFAGHLDDPLRRASHTQHLGSAASLGGIGHRGRRIAFARTLTGRRGGIAGPSIRIVGRGIGFPLSRRANSRLFYGAYP